MLESNIPFMTEKQVFLPFIGTLLMEEKNNALYKEKFMFSTQQLFLMYLYNRQNKLYVANVGKKLPYSAMTLSRAVKQLEASDLFLVYKDGVNKVIESKYDRRELFERAKPFLYIKILVSEQGNAVCEKTVDLSQFVDYEERQKGLS